MPERERREKDNWDKADVVIKGLAATLITAAITVYGISSDKRAFQISESNRQAQVLVQTMNNRELAAADMRARMFDTLMSHYFQSDIGSTDLNEPWSEEIHQQKHTVLRLIALNFEDNFSFKPLFEELVAKTTRREQIEQLQKSAKIISKRQINSVVGGGGEICDLTLETGHPVDLSQKCGVPIFLRPLEIGTDMIRVKTTESDEDDGFVVDYFDMPLLDTSTIGELTYSIVLTKTDPMNKTAHAKLATLPAFTFNSRNRMRVDRMIGDFAAPDSNVRSGVCLGSLCFYLSDNGQ